MSLKDRIKGRVLAMDAVARPWAAESPLRAELYEFLLFGLKQAWASLFAGAMLALLVGSHFLWPARPQQRHGWAMVSFAKLGSWYLLIMLSFVLVSLVHRPRAPGEGETTNPLLTGVEDEAPQEPGRRSPRDLLEL
jgi:hypothetical protein